MLFCLLIPVSKLLAQGPKQLTLQWLGQQISNHLLSRQVLDSHLLSGDAVLDEEVSDVDVSGSVRSRTTFLSHRLGAGVVLVECSCLHLVRLVNEKVSRPDRLSGGIGQTNQLSLSGGLRHNLLLGRADEDCTTSQGDHKPSVTFAVSVHSVRGIDVGQHADLFVGLQDDTARLSCVDVLD